MPRFDEGIENSKLLKGNIVLMGNPTAYGEILAENLLVEDITRANLQTLISNSELVRGKGYRITNAVGSTLSLLVQALTANTISEYAYNTVNGETYKYDITADTAILEPNPIALGTANQLLGVNASATAQEYKTLSSSDDNISVVHTANDIDLTLNTDGALNGQSKIYNSVEDKWVNSYQRLFGKQGLNIFPHRGVIAWGAPENSLISAYHSYLAGFKFTEFDVNYTSDGQLVVIHDASLNSEYTNSDGSPIVGTVNINDITLAQARTYIRSSSIDGYKVQIATLDEYLEACMKYGLIPIVEPKFEFPEIYDDLFISTTRKYFKDENVIINSFYDDVVDRLIGKAGYYPFYNSGTLNSAQNGNGGVSKNYVDIDQTLINQAVAANVPIFAYTVDSQTEFNRLLKLGISNITSNNIASEKSENATYIDSWESGLSFTNSTIVGGSASAGESLATLNNAGTLQTPDINCVQFGSIYADIVVNGTCTIQLYVAGVLYDTITNTDTTTQTYRIQRLINLNNSYYIKITSTQADCKIISLNTSSLTIKDALQNRRFVKNVQSNNGFSVNRGLEDDYFSHFKSNVATNPSMATWDSGGVGSHIAFSEDSNTEFHANVAQSNASSRGIFVGKKSRGTLATPTAVINGDVLTSLLSAGYDGTTFRAFGEIEFITDGVVSSAVVPTAMTFKTGTNSRVERARITSSGRFLFGTTTDSGAMFQIVGTTAITGNTTIVGTFGVVGNTSITGTLSSTGQNTITKTAGGVFLRADGATTNASYNVFNNTGGNFYYGITSSTGVGLFGGAVSAYAIGICAESARDIFIGTTNLVRLGIFSTGEVNIGSAIARPSASALFSITSTTQGFLPPRMTTAQRDAIVSPVAGLMIYNTTTNKLNVYTTGWEQVTSA